MTILNATPAAQELLSQLAREHGELTLHVSGGYGLSVVCFAGQEFKIGPSDILMGRFDNGIPLYFMPTEAPFWDGYIITLDVARGFAAGFSIEGPRGVHFTLSKEAGTGSLQQDNHQHNTSPPPAVRQG